MMPPLKSLLKVGKIIWTLNYILSFQKMVWRPAEKIVKTTRILTFFHVAVTFTLKEKLSF